MEAVEEFQKRRLPDVEALIRIVRVAAPFQCLGRSLENGRYILYIYNIIYILYYIYIMYIMYTMYIMYIMYIMYMYIAST
jgi:hypothetical protein